MFDTALVKVLGYGVFWNRRTRQRFRSVALGWIRGAKNFLYLPSFKTLPRSQGERLVELQVAICGMPVYVRRWARPQYRVALLVDEFFGGWETPIGGYGALARKYICKYIPNEEIQIDVLLDAGGGNRIQAQLVDRTMIYRLPGETEARRRWLDKQGYNLFLSIEMTFPSFKILSEYKTNAILLYWIQDPRELKMYQSRVQTVTRLRDYDWAYMHDVAAWILKQMAQSRIAFVSQGESLSLIAREMYQIPAALPIQDLPNPVEIDFAYKLNEPSKENKIIFLGRLEAQKRAWIVCEIAKAMPQHEFYVLGATGKGRDEVANAKSLEPYRNPDGTAKIRNLHFAGHVEGDVKISHLKTAKLVLNTSIWEGIPVSWLEALSYGTLIVSAFDRDEIAGRFGTFVGEIMGDGTNEADINRFTASIGFWMAHDLERNAIAQKAIEFVRSRHSIATFTERMRATILSHIP
jgi:glycosyltransferase involved in cell wall biosynthesis